MKYSDAVNTYDDAQLGLVNKVIASIREYDSTFEPDNFIHDDGYPCSHDWFQLVMKQIHKPTASITAGTGTIAVLHNNQWLINLADPSGRNK